MQVQGIAAVDACVHTGSQNAEKLLKNGLSFFKHYVASQFSSHTILHSWLVSWDAQDAKHSKYAKA